MHDPKTNAGADILEESRQPDDASPSASSQVFETICLPTTKALRVMTAPYEVPVKEWAIGLAANMPTRFEDLRVWSVRRVRVKPAIEPNKTWADYDQYFGVVRNADNAAETLVAACAKTLRDIKETSGHGHDLSEELQSDLLAGIKTVLEMINE